jgi:hypothetical protein
MLRIIDFRALSDSTRMESALAGGDDARFRNRFIAKGLNPRLGHHPNSDSVPQECMSSGLGFALCEWRVVQNGEQ